MKKLFAVLVIVVALAAIGGVASAQSNGGISPWAMAGYGH